MSKRILHLTLKKKWFDMILSGEKKEEYRECTDYWYKRLSNFFDLSRRIGSITYKEFDVVKFRHGYAKNAPEITIECYRLHFHHHRGASCGDSGK